MARRHKTRDRVEVLKFVDLSRAKDRHAVEALRAGRSVPSWRMRRLVTQNPNILRCPAGWKKVPVGDFPGVYICLPPAQHGGMLELAEGFYHKP